MNLAGLAHQRPRTRDGAEIVQHLGGGDPVIAQLRHRLARARVDPVGGDDLAAFLAQPPGRRPSDPLTGAGHDAHLVGEPARAGRPGIQVARHAVSLWVDSDMSRAAADTRRFCPANEDLRYASFGSKPLDIDPRSTLLVLNPI